MRAFVRAAIFLPALLAGTAGRSQSASLADQLQPRLGIGDLRQLDQMAGPSALPVWYDLLERADAGEFRQFSGGIRGVLIRKIVGLDDHATYLGDQIEQASSLPAEQLQRSRAFQALASVGSPQAIRELKRFLYDPRAPGGKVAPANAALAAQALARVFGLEAPEAVGTHTFDAAEVSGVRRWMEAQDRSPALVETSVSPSPVSDFPSALPQLVPVVRLPRAEEIGPVSTERGDHDEAVWLGLAGLALSGAIGLSFVCGRATRKDCFAQPDRLELTLARAELQPAETFR